MVTYANGAPVQSLWSEGDHPLAPTERTRLEAALESGESVVATLRGRTASKVHIWALTDRRLLAVNVTRAGQATGMAFSEIRRLEEQEGVHGTTVQLDHERLGRVFLVAVAPPASAAFVPELATRCGITATFLPSAKPKPAPVAVPMPERRVAPPAGDGADILEQMERLSVLHARGQVTDEEFSRMKARLLDR